MRNDRITRAIVGSAIAVSVSIAVFAAAPAASTAGAGATARSSRPDPALRSAPASVAGSVSMTGHTPPDVATDEAALMRSARHHRDHQAWLHRLRAWKLSHAGKRGTSGAAAGGSVRDMVVAIFTTIAGPGQVGTALCVADRESNFDPNARNRYSSAAGVFQWIASSWASYSARYGFAGTSVFDPYANIAVAAHAVADGGWGPWGGGCW